METGECGAAIANEEFDGFIPASATFPVLTWKRCIAEAKLASPSRCMDTVGTSFVFEILQCPLIHDTKTRVGEETISFPDNVLIFPWYIRCIRARQTRLLLGFIAVDTV
jgi:hypothetical protein